jgi:adenine deaminase
VSEGHVNQSVRVAIACGVPPVTAIQMATLNAAEHFGVSGIVGMIAPRRSADILILPDLREMTPDLVIAQGNIVAQEGRLSIDKPEFQFPDWSRRSVRLSKPINEADFRLEAQGRNEVNVNVIGLIENQAPNRHLKMRLPVKNGEIHPDIESDIAKIALVERHHNSGRVQVGLVKGFGFRSPCAVASTVAHDSHHLLVAGTSTSDMVIAVNTLAEYGGGQIVVRQGEILGCVPLPIGGLMSDLPASEVARQTKEVLAGFRSCGSQMSNPNMQLSLAALVVIPELRLSDLGLVNVNDFKFIPVVESE